MVNVKINLLRKFPWWALFFLGAAWIFILAPVCTGGFVPGNSGDSRFNLYVLEHFYRWLAGTERSLLNAPFFYPYPATIGFSDPHTLTGFLYAGLRFAGVTSNDALCVWFALGNLLNFLTAYWVFRKLGLRDLGAGIGAFLFAFSLPCTAQFGHIQLAWRCTVPLGILCLQSYLEKRRPVVLGVTALVLAIQTAMSFYLGLFLLLLMGAWIIGWMALQFRSHKDRSACLIRNLLPATWSKTEVILLLLLSVVSLAVVLWGVWPNLEASKLYGFKRGWGEIAAGLPQLRGYLLAFHSNVWWPDHSHLPGLPMWWEQNLFPGLMVILACLIGIWPASWNENKVIPVAKWSLAILMVITLSIGGSAFYMMLTKFPAFSAVRSVSRIILILMFPASLITGSWIDWLVHERRGIPVMSIGIALILWTVFESANIVKSRVSENDWVNRIAVLKRRVLEKTPIQEISNKILVVIQSREERKKWDAFERELDAMLLSQELGIPTMNGYSGNIPQGWSSDNLAENIASCLRTANTFLSVHRLEQAGFAKNNILCISSDGAELQPRSGSKK